MIDGVMIKKKDQTSTAVIIAMLVYNAIVVVCTLAGVYYISGWMIFLLLALMNAKTGDKE